MLCRGRFILVESVLLGDLLKFIRNLHVQHTPYPPAQLPAFVPPLEVHSSALEFNDYF